MAPSGPTLYDAQCRSRREHTLSQRDGHARIRAGGDVTRGQYSVARCMQLFVDDDRPGSVEFDLTLEQVRGGDARDLHDHAADAQPTALAAGRPNEHHLLEAIAPRCLCQLPPREILDAR